MRAPQHWQKKLRRRWASSRVITQRCFPAEANILLSVSTSILHFLWAARLEAGTLHISSHRNKKTESVGKGDRGRRDEEAGRVCEIVLVMEIFHEIAAINRPFHHIRDCAADADKRPSVCQAWGVQWGTRHLKLRAWWHKQTINK